jgi:hypothetical protein
MSGGVLWFIEASGSTWSSEIIWRLVHVYILAQCRYIFPNSNSLPLHRHIPLTGITKLLTLHYLVILSLHFVCTYLTSTCRLLLYHFQYEFHCKWLPSFVHYLFRTTPYIFIYTYTTSFPVIERPYLGLYILWNCNSVISTLKYIFPLKSRPLPILYHEIFISSLYSYPPISHFTFLYSVNLR